MAWNGSGVFAWPLMQVLGVETTKMDLNGDAFKCALFGNGVTPAYDAATAALASYLGSESTWSSGNEVTGTGYTAGGVTLSSPTLSIAGSGSTTNIKWTVSTNPQWTSATFTAYGCLIYSSTLTNTQGNCLVAVDFNGPFQVNNGTFTITWSASGVFYIDVVP